MAAEKKYYHSDEKKKNGLTHRIASSLRSNKLILDGIFHERSSLDDVFARNDLVTVSDLSARNNNISYLPKNFATNLANVIRIDLSNNNLKVLDASFKTLRNLEELTLDDNDLRNIPDSLNEARKLKILSARGNKLAYVPATVGSLTKLESIDLSRNQLKCIPESLINLTNLKTFVVASNQLKIVPECILEGTPELRILDLSENRISDFERPPLSEKLRRVDFSRNSPNKNFPKWIFLDKYSSLEVLTLDETIFSTYEAPPRRNDTSNLENLSMVNCRLSDTTFGYFARSMGNLKRVDIGNRMKNTEGNMFWLLPCESFENPENLVELSIKGVGLPALPREINVLSNLRKLDVSGNNLSWLPDEICDLTKLELFNADANNLSALPNDIGKWKEMKILFLESNKLSSLPESITTLENLELLDLYNNEFLEIPSQVTNIETLRAFDIDGNCFSTKDIRLRNVAYSKARSTLRSVSDTMIFRNDQPKILDLMDDSHSRSSLESIIDCTDDPTSEMNTNWNDTNTVENWDTSEDSSGEFDPTVPVNSEKYRFQSFIDSPVSQDGTFCPSDLHNPPVRRQVASLNQIRPPVTFEPQEGQFDDA